MNFIRELPLEYLDLCPLIDNKYRVLFKLGSGRFSKVKMGINLATNQRVAIKIMNYKPNMQDKRKDKDELLSIFLNEIFMCLQSKHKHVVDILNFNINGVCHTADGQEKKILYYVMKIADHGELFRLSQAQSLSERTARYVFKQLMTALNNMHLKGIAHCDIKTQNVLLDVHMNLKIADFGYSRFFIDESKTHVRHQASNAVGSIKCNAPELMNDCSDGGYHADQIDSFACGCLLFQIVMKAQPFKSSQFTDQHYKKIASNDTNKFWEIFAHKYTPSHDFKNLIEKLLNPNPKQRLNAEEIMQHPWYKGQTSPKKEYKKQLGSRLKKVMQRVRKEHENEIKKTFSKYKQKRQICKMQDCPLIDPNSAFQEQVRQIKQIIQAQQIQQSDSSSSNGDKKETNELEVDLVAQLEIQTEKRKAL